MEALKKPTTQQVVTEASKPAIEPSKPVNSEVRKSINEGYKNMKPQNIKPNFKNRDDVINCLSDVFKAEYQYFVYPMQWITIEKDLKIIGFILYEQWKNTKEIWRISQMIILLDKQCKGCGTSLIKTIFIFDHNIKKNIVSTKHTNVKAIDFHKRDDFKIHHDSELSKNIYPGTR